MIDNSNHGESLKVYQAIFENSPLAIMYTDKLGVISVCNEKASKLFGAPQEKLIGFSYQLIKNTEMRDAIAKALGGEKSFFEGEYLTVTGNVLRQMRANFNPSFSEEGSLSGVVGVFEDISDRMDAENSLKELEERFRLAFHTSPDSININKMDGTYVEINQGFTDLTGYSKEDVIGRSSKDIKIWDIPEDREKLIEALQNDGFVQNLESTFLMKDGSRKTALMSATIIKLQGIPHILSVTKDITELREAEKAHQELQLHLCKAQKLDSVGVLAGGIAHDFNNLLVAILGNIDLALKNPGSSDVPDLLGQARNASIRAKNLTQQLLTFAKGGDPVKKISSVRNIIEDTAEFILHGSKVKCEYSYQKNLPKIEADSGQISQVIQNIILNADQAMPEGGKILISCHSFENRLSDVPALAEGSYVRISISDRGPGISEDDVERIFDPYFTTKEKGSGLGLAIAYSIIEKHGGNVFVESEKGRGTCFNIYLPLTESTEQEVSTEKSENVLSETEINLSILVMDDEELVRKVLQKMLQKLGHTVFLASDGQDAIEIYKRSEKDIDLVIMDLTIPGGVGGKEAMKGILEINPDARVIVASGYSNDQVMANFRDYGFCSAIIKPFELNDLSTAIRQAISLSQSGFID